MTAPKRGGNHELTLIRGAIEDLREEVKPIQEIRDLLLGDGDKQGYVERVRTVEADLKRLNEENREFLREAPNKLRAVEKWLQDQQDFKRDISRKMWGGLIGGGFSILIAIVLAIFTMWRATL